MEEKIGRYRLVSRLGSGGMGDVYLAHDPRIRRDVALKLLSGAFLERPTFRERFEREAQTIARLEHPAIVPVHDFGEVDGKLYLVMRLMSGGTLGDRLRQGPIPVAEASAILTHLSSALDRAHEAGIIHRDLKPANILFDDDGHAYLSDFGIVKVIAADTLTAEHALLGTPRYMSPEQALADRELDGRSDVYSLGAVVYEMLTGEAPYTATSPMGVAMKHITEPPPPLRQARPDLSAALEAVLRQAMAKDVDARFATAGAFARAFEAAASGRAPIPVAAETVVEALPIPAGADGGDGRARSRRVAIVGGAGLLLVVFLFCVLAAGALFGLGGPSAVLAMLQGTTATATATPTAPTPTQTTATATVTATTPATETATETETATPTAEPPTETPTMPPTPVPPTDTPEPASITVTTVPIVPAGPPSPTPAPVTCSRPPLSDFASIYDRDSAALGCPTNGGRSGVSMAVEDFQGGRMLWRGDTQMIVVLYNSGQWAQYNDTWREGDATFTCGGPESPPDPVRGFSKVWCTYDVVRQNLGPAINAEWADSATTQDFETGHIIRLSDGRTYILYGNGRWRS